MAAAFSDPSAPAGLRATYCPATTASTSPAWMSWFWAMVMVSRERLPHSSASTNAAGCRPSVKTVILGLRCLVVADQADRSAGAVQAAGDLAPRRAGVGLRHVAGRNRRRGALGERRDRRGRSGTLDGRERG